VLPIQERLAGTKRAHGTMTAAAAADAPPPPPAGSATAYDAPPRLPFGGVCGRAAARRRRA
jgi:hypothetical protein